PLAVARLRWLTVSRTALAVARLPLAVAGLSLAIAALRAGRSRGTWRVRCVGAPGRGHGRTIRLAGGDRHLARRRLAQPFTRSPVIVPACARARQRICRVPCSHACSLGARYHTINETSLVSAETSA